jgi:DNA-binding NarL/FixJ family response regulator
MTILGSDLACHLKAQSFHGLILIRSANSSSSDVERYMAQGCVDACLGKEGSNHDIAAAIRKVFVEKKSKL